MKNVLLRLRRLLQSVFNGSRNYGCLPEDTGEPRPAEKAGDPFSNRLESANSVEKDAALR
jgi:hypothetical protein